MITQRTTFKVNDFFYDSVEWATPHGSVTHVTRPNKENGGYNITVEIKSEKLTDDQVFTVWATNDQVIKNEVVKVLNTMIKKGVL